MEIRFGGLFILMSLCVCAAHFIELLITPSSIPKLSLSDQIFWIVLQTNFALFSL
jgi:hypothetical protein